MTQKESANPRPLDGITVLSLEHAVAAPFASRQLADLGARVIKVERPGSGDFARNYDSRVKGQSSYFVWLNRSKESITLDIRHPDGARVIRQLLEKCDVLVQNLAPGASSRLGLSAAALRPSHPRLIVCDISGYGQNGPYRDRRAYDLLIQAETGLLTLTGTPEAPSRAGISVADIAAGMYAYSQILVALLQRGRTGRGSHIDVSMLEALGEWMGNPMYYAFANQPQAPRSAASHPSVYPYGPFAMREGAVIFSVQNEREWETFCRIVMAQPALRQDAKFCTVEQRNAHRGELQALIEARFAALESATVIALLDEAGIGNARMNDMHGFWNHPQLAARGRWTEVASPGGPVPALFPPGASDAFTCRMDPIPAVGEHSDAILGELGYTEDEIRKLRAGNVI